jgi:thiol-disulfide isomerase/thioredoxin
MRPRARDLAPTALAFALALPGACGGSGSATVPTTAPVAAPQVRDVRSRLPSRYVGEKPALEGKVVLLRWWTDGCPFCEQSLPALAALGKDAADLVKIGVYHPKPPRAVEDDDVLAAAKRFGWPHAIAVDENWSSLETAWPPDRRRTATSITLLLDRQGRVRWSHPGPELHPSTDAEHVECAREFLALEAALATVLAE